jgi:1-acyl-sn-glycerol-3-phosphate acyltransferase
MDKLRSFFIWIFNIAFGIIMFPVTFLVWFILYPFDRRRVVTHWLLVFQSIIISWLIQLRKIQIEGREKAQKETAYVIISNHQSIIDILIINCLRYRYRWISKIENLRVPLLGWYIRMADYIVVDRGNKESKSEMMEKSAENIRNGISIMIFPEGTRSTDKEIGLFKQGAFQLALMTDKSILPILIDGTGELLPKHGLVFSHGSRLRIKVLDPVHPGTFGTGNPEELAGKFRDLMIDELKKMREKIQD